MLDNKLLRCLSFIETMVYDNATVLEYEDALKVLEQIAETVHN